MNINPILANVYEKDVERIDVTIVKSDKPHRIEVRVTSHGPNAGRTERSIIEWTETGTCASMERKVENAARFYPCEVRIVAAHEAVRTVKREAFLAEAHRKQQHGPWTLGVTKGRRAHGATDPDTCERGVLSARGLARTTDAHGLVQWSVNAETNDIADHGTHETEALRAASWRALYAAMASENDASPRFDDRERARKMGIHLPTPSRTLLPWQAPTTAQTPGTRRVDELRAVRPDALLVDDGLNAVEGQMLAHAAKHDGSTGADALMTPAEGLAGFPWYDALARIVRVAAQVGSEDGWGERIDPREPTSPETLARLESRPERIRLLATIRTPDGDETDTHIETDLAFAGEPLAWALDSAPIVRKETTLRTQALAQTIEDAFFCPSEEAGTRAQDAERASFGDDALAVAAAILCEETEAVRIRARKHARETIGPLAREYRRAMTIRVDANGEASVAFDTAQAGP